MNETPPPIASRYLSPKAGARASIALGTMNFGKRTSPAESARIVARAVERGLALLDTANAYNDGESERIVGRAIAGRREAFVVATKVGLGRASGKPEGLSRTAIRRAIGESLARLGTDYVDIYYLHAPDHATPIEETMDAIAEIVREGKVRHLGVSNYASWQILEIMRLSDERGIDRPRVSQVIYNLFIRQIEIEYLRFARRYPIHTTVYNPLAGGLLTDRYPSVDALAKAGSGLAIPVEGSRFDKNRMYQKRYWNERAFEAAAAYRALAAESQMSLVELAYAWLAGAPGVDSMLVGPASVEQLDTAIDAAERPLAPEIYERARAIHEAHAGTDAAYAR